MAFYFSSSFLLNLYPSCIGESEEEHSLPTSLKKSKQLTVTSILSIRVCIIYYSNHMFEPNCCHHVNVGEHSNNPYLCCEVKYFFILMFCRFAYSNPITTMYKCPCSAIFLCLSFGKFVITAQMILNYSRGKNFFNS